MIKRLCNLLSWRSWWPPYLRRLAEAHLQVINELEDEVKSLSYELELINQKTVNYKVVHNSLPTSILERKLRVQHDNVHAAREAVNDGIVEILADARSYVRVRSSYDAGYNTDVYELQLGVVKLPSE